MSLPSPLCTTSLLILLTVAAGPLWGAAASSSAPVAATPAATPAAPAAVSVAPSPAAPTEATPSASMSIPGEPSAAGSVSAVISDGDQDSLTRVVNEIALTTSRAGRTGEPVLVIPSRETDPQSFDSLVEDLSIMGRIIQRSLSDALLPDNAAMDWLLLKVAGQSPGPGPRLFFPLTRRPKPMYIGGYGALFFLQVDFPLLPPREQVEQAAAERVDPVWAEARRSLLEPHAALLTNGAPAAEPYDENKVQMLKDKLKTVLRHATNIRALAPDEWLVIVVQGTAPEAGGQATANAAPEAAPSCGRTMLTLRARKADIDLYAKDQLDPVQFDARLQLVMSR